MIYDNIRYFFHANGAKIAKIQSGFENELRQRWDFGAILENFGQIDRLGVHDR
jgi:hypothetical protein